MNLHLIWGTEDPPRGIINIRVLRVCTVHGPLLDKPRNPTWLDVSVFKEQIMYT